MINPAHPHPGQIENIIFFFFTLLGGTSKGLMKALNVFTKPFEAPQRSVKIKL